MSAALDVQLPLPLHLALDGGLRLSSISGLITSPGPGPELLNSPSHGWHWPLKGVVWAVGVWAHRPQVTPFGPYQAPPPPPPCSDTWVWQVVSGDCAQGDCASNSMHSQKEIKADHQLENAVLGAVRHRAARGCLPVPDANTATGVRDVPSSQPPSSNICHSLSPPFPSLYFSLKTASRGG